MESSLTRLSPARRAGLDLRLSETGLLPSAAPTRKPEHSFRTKAQRDRDRILYSSAFQRLAYVTQVTAPESGHTFHNRMSHSLKVAQVGRRNAERLKQLAKDKRITGAAARMVLALDPDAIEASCLAHDLGHPPFGHIAEEVLHKKASEHVVDGFEGNAQSFRIVTRLAVRSDRTDEPGLDLTRQTLDGLLKYPWRHWASDPLNRRERKWGYYEDDKDAFGFARDGWPEETVESLPERCLAAEIMNWADDLTYAVHDVDDFFRAGLVPLDRLGEPNGSEGKHLEVLLHDARQADPRNFPDHSIDALVAAIRRVVGQYGLDAPYEHTASARARMRTSASKLITRYLEAFSIQDEPGGTGVRLKIAPRQLLEVTALKLLVHVYVVRRPGLAVVQHGQRRVIEDLFNFYFRASSQRGLDGGDHRLFPPGARERLNNSSATSTGRARVVLDFLASLTEESAIQLHHRLSGGWTAPTLDATAQVG
jgi:dGTPase